MTRRQDHFLKRILRQMFLVMWLLSLVGLVSGEGMDGLNTWQWRNPLPQGNHLQSVTSGGGKLVAVGYHGKILVSENPTANPASWTQVDVAPHIYFSGVTYHDGMFVAVGNGFWSSTNGLDWVQRVWKFGNAVIWANGVFVSAGPNGEIFTSSDGIQWTTRSSGTTHGLQTIIYGQGMYVAAGGIYESGVLLTSPDAIEWTPRTVGKEVIDGVAYGNGLFMSVGFDYSYPTPPVGWIGSGIGIVRISLDGVNWTPHLLSAAFMPYAIHYHAGHFILLTSDGIMTSVDGLNWTNRYQEWPNSLNAVGSFNGSLYAVGAGGSVIVSSDALNWQRLTGSWESLNDLVRGGDMIVAVGGFGSIMTSEDGSQWTSRYQAENFSFLAVTYGDGVFVAVGESGYVVTEDHPYGARTPQIIFTSSDGIAWEQHDSPVEDALSDVIFANGIFMAVGGSQGIDATVITSSDGENWNAQNVTMNTQLYGVAYGNGVFAAAGYSGDIMVSGDNGATWSKRPSGSSNMIRGISFQNGIFITGDNYGNVMTSTNGTNWHLKSTDTGFIFYDLAYGNGVFVAVGGFETLVSTNAIDWQTLRSVEGMSPNAIIYCDGGFITAGGGGAILQSAYTTSPAIVRAKTDVNGFRFSVTGEKGRPYRIQSSTSMNTDAVWTNWLDHTNGLDPKWFVDSEVNGYSQRFYRLVLP